MGVVVEGSPANPAPALSPPQVVAALHKLLASGQAILQRSAQAVQEAAKGPGAAAVRRAQTLLGTPQGARPSPPLPEASTAAPASRPKRGLQKA